MRAAPNCRLPLTVWHASQPSRNWWIQQLLLLRDWWMLLAKEAEETATAVSAALSGTEEAQVSLSG